MSFIARLAVMVAALSACDSVFRIDQIDVTDLGPWSLVQARGQAADGYTATIDVRATGAGNMIAVGIWEANGSRVISIDDGVGSQYVPVPAAIGNNTIDGVEVWYTADAKPGATAITVQGNNFLNAAHVWEVSGFSRPLVESADFAVGELASAPVGPMLTTAVASPFIVAFTIVQSEVDDTAAGGPFVQDWNFLGNSWAHLDRNDAPAGSYQAEWGPMTQSGAYVASAAAFAP